MESTAMRPRMRKGSVHDLCLGDPVEQFTGADGRVPSPLADLALISHRVEFTQIAENLCGDRESLENARRRIGRRDQPVRALLIEVTQVSHLFSAPRGIKKATNLLQSRDAVDRK